MMGLPVALHPSLGRPASDFAPIVGALRDAGHEVVLVDPGHGATLHELAAHVGAALDRRGIERAHVVGHAFGNRVMRCFAADHPERVASVALFGAGGRVPAEPEASAALAAVLWSGATGDELVDAVRTAMFAPGNDVPSEWITGWDGALARVQSEAGAATDVASWWLGAPDARMLVVQGLEDRMALPANGRSLAEALGSRVTLRETTPMGHAMVPEQPGWLAEVLVEFLASVERG